MATPTRRRRPPSDDKPSRRAPSSGDYDEERRDDDQFEEERSTRRRRSREEPEDEAPRRSRRSRDDEPDDRDDPPRRRRGSRDEEEDEGSSRRRSRDDEGDDDDRRSRRSRDDDRDDDRGRRPDVASGWDAADRNRSQGDWANEVKLTNEEQIFKFLDDAPFAVYRMHWIERPGKKSFTCLDKATTPEADRICPLCDVGDTPTGKNAFNVLRLSGDNEPELEVLVVGVKLLGQLKDANKGRSGPLTKHYWGLSRSGKGNSTAYNLIPIKERDLDDPQEGWDTLPLTEEEIEAWEAKAYTSKTFPDYTKKRDLEEIAAEIEDD